MSPVTLVSMSPSGELFITRDSLGRIWLHTPEGAGGSGEIDERTAALAVAKHGFDPVEQSFESWATLDERRQERAALVTPAVIVDRAALDREDVSDLLATGHAWLAEGLWERAHRLGTNLLRLPVVTADPTVYGDVVAFLEEIGRVPLHPLRAPAHPRHLARWQQVRAIAA